MKEFYAARRILFIVLCLFSILSTGTARSSDNPLAPQSSAATGEIRILVVVVRFPDVQPGVPIDRLRAKTVNGLDQYIREASYNRAWLKADFIGYRNLPDSINEYRVSPYNFKVDKRRVRKLAEDTMTALEKEVDFSRYDHILIVPAANTQPGKGYGMLCYCANPGMLAGYKGTAGWETVRSKGGKEFRGGIFVGAENAHLGMFAH
jgi:hypothetical protein